MNILIVCPHYAPDAAPTGEVMTSIVEGLAERGHRMHLFTSLPWYRDHAIEPGWEHHLSQTEEVSWGWITRLHPFPTDKSSIVSRALAFGGFTALATARSMKPKIKPDVVLAMSPPIFLGMCGWAAAKRFGAKFVFNIQDVFPDVAVEVGAISNPKIISVAKTLERRLYLGSDAVTVLSEDLADNLRTKIGPNHQPERVRVIPNFVDTELIQAESTETSYREEFGLVGKTVVMYAGNLGYSQSVEMMLSAARRFADRDDVAFVINGGGSNRGSLVEAAAGLDNVTFVGLQPKERLSEVLASADIHTVLLKRGLARSSVPSKMYSVLASGRPIVASVDEGTEVANTIEAAGAGIAVGPEDHQAFGDALAELLDDPDRRSKMGTNARSFVENWASPEAVARLYEELFSELLGSPGASRLP